MKKTILTITALLAFATLLVACGSKKENTKTATSDSSKAVKKAERPKTITVKDAKGKVTVPTDPSKVVVFDNGSLDTIKALGASDSVIGVAADNLPDYLKSFKGVENAGGIKEPDLEKINQLQPELIIISGRQAAFQADLEKIAPVLYLQVDPSQTWASTKQNIETLAQVFGKEDKAKAKLAKLEKEIAAVKAKAEKSGKTSLTLMVNNGSISAFGKGSRFDIINTTFGFKTVDDTLDASTHGQNVAYEYVLEKNPDMIFVIDRTNAIGGADDTSAVSDNELVKETTAGKTGKIVVLNSAIWYLSGGGIESTQLMLDDVKKALD
jgi:iron complex transport system substrate-binding protein